MGIKMKNISLNYEKSILSNISIDFEKNGIYGLVGENGAGKTSILKCIVGLEDNYVGDIYVNNLEIGEFRGRILKETGSLIENPVFFDNYTALENLKFHEQFMQKPIGDYKKILNDFGLDDTNKNKVSKYSLGMKQRLGIARAFSTDPSLVILDEPFNALDPVGVNMVCEYMLQSKKTKTIIVSSHALNDLIKISDTIGILKTGLITSEFDANSSNKKELEQLIIQYMIKG